MSNTFPATTPESAARDCRPLQARLAERRAAMALVKEVESLDPGLPLDPDKQRDLANALRLLCGSERKAKFVDVLACIAQ